MKRKRKLEQWLLGNRAVGSREIEGFFVVVYLLVFWKWKLNCPCGQKRGYK